MKVDILLKMAEGAKSKGQGARSKGKKVSSEQ
jgi:hypothetical protein